MEHGDHGDAGDVDELVRRLHELQRDDPQVYAAAMLLFRRLVEKKAPLKR